LPKAACPYHPNEKVKTEIVTDNQGRKRKLVICPVCGTLGLFE